jgi:hypothetical protein
MAAMILSITISYRKGIKLDSRILFIVAIFPAKESSSSTSVNFTFIGIDNFGIANFTCSIDGSNLSNCTSPITYRNLKPNVAYTFEVYTTDIADNMDPPSADFIWTTIVNPLANAKH